MKELEAKHKKRLVHVLDVHWYPEARGTKRITDKDNVAQDGRGAAAGAAQPLGPDATSEKSWIAGASGQADPPHPVAARADRRRAIRARSWA